MKKIIFAIFAVMIVGLFTVNASAQMMGGFSSTNWRTGADWEAVVEHTLREEKEGQELWQKFQAQQVTCADFGEEQFGVLGEYFMGQMMGESHTAMNVMMIQAHGEDGEEQIHIVIGKRLSGCDPAASVAGISGGWMSLAPMMWGWGSNQIIGHGFGGSGWIFMILWWGLVIVGIVSIVKWLLGHSRRRG